MKTKRHRLEHNNKMIFRQPAPKCGTGNRSWRQVPAPPTHRPRHFDSPPKKVNFDTHTKTKSPHKNQANFDPMPEIKSTLTPTLTSSRYRCPVAEPTWYRSGNYRQVIFNRHTKTISVTLPTLKLKSFQSSTLKSSEFWPPTLNLNQFNSYTEIISSSIPHTEIKPISTIHTKTKSTSMLTLKPGDFRFAYTNYVNFYHPRKKSVIWCTP